MNVIKSISGVRFLVLALGILLSCPLFASELKIESFEHAPMDVTAQRTKVLDNNGDVCALVIVYLPVKGATFSNNVVKQDFNINEYHVYMVPGSKKLKLQCPGAETLEINMGEYLGRGLEGGNTYKLKLKVYEEFLNSNDKSISWEYKGESQEHLSPEERMRRSAEQGDADAQNYLGVMYQNGQGVPQNYQEAAKWFRKAAEQGDEMAQFNLATLYQKGVGVPQDGSEAAKWYRKAAEQGNVNAQYNLAWLYHAGAGVPQDGADAVKWYRKAAAQGNANAQYNLGVMYQNGQGVARDYAEAMKWYRKAADQGNSNAQFNLGWMYQNGAGVPKDINEAKNWYSKSAMLGNAEATKALSRLK